jgi:phosphotransacetylase
MSCKKKKCNTRNGKDLMEDGSHFGTMMVYKGHADGMVSEHPIHDFTSITIY